MIPHPSLHWNEILAAYADGEFEGRDDLAILKRRVEDWLARHPEAQEELGQIRQIKQVWQETTPPTPSPETWRRMAQELAETPSIPVTVRRTWRRAVALTAALAACLTLVITLAWPPQRVAGPSPEQAAPSAEDDAPFPVAAAHEVEILNVEEADTHTLVIGQLPVQGPLELAAPGDVSVTSVQPAARDNMLPEVRVQGPGRPMIWARLDTDE